MRIIARYAIPLLGIYIGLSIGLDAYWDWFMAQDWEIINIHNVGNFLHKNIAVGSVIGLVIGDVLDHQIQRRHSRIKQSERKEFIKSQLGRADLPEDQRVALAGLLYEIEQQSAAK